MMYTDDDNLLHEIDNFLAEYTSDGAEKSPLHISPTTHKENNNVQSTESPQCEIQFLGKKNATFEILEDDEYGLYEHDPYQCNWNVFYKPLCPEMHAANIKLEQQCSKMKQEQTEENLIHTFSFKLSEKEASQNSFCSSPITNNVQCSEPVQFQQLQQSPQSIEIQPIDIPPPPYVCLPEVDFNVNYTKTNNLAPVACNQLRKRTLSPPPFVLLSDHTEPCFDVSLNFNVPPPQTVLNTNSFQNHLNNNLEAEQSIEYSSIQNCQNFDVPSPQTVLNSNLFKNQFNNNLEAEQSIEYSSIKNCQNFDVPPPQTVLNSNLFKNQFNNNLEAEQSIEYSSIKNCQNFDVPPPQTVLNTNLFKNQFNNNLEAKQSIEYSSIQNCQSFAPPQHIPGIVNSIAENARTTPQFMPPRMSPTPCETANLPFFQQHQPRGIRLEMKRPQFKTFNPLPWNGTRGRGVFHRNRLPLISKHNSLLNQRAKKIKTAASRLTFSPFRFPPPKRYPPQSGNSRQQNTTPFLPTVTPSDFCVVTNTHQPTNNNHLPIINTAESCKKESDQDWLNPAHFSKSNMQWDMQECDLNKDIANHMIKDYLSPVSLVGGTIKFESRKLANTGVREELERAFKIHGQLKNSWWTPDDMLFVTYTDRNIARKIYSLYPVNKKSSY